MANDQQPWQNLGDYVRVGNLMVQGKLIASPPSPSPVVEIQKLQLAPRAPDPFGGPGFNMPVGYIDNYNDPSMPNFSRYLWKGGDNQGTWLTGIDATGFNDGDVILFENLSESGIDVGTVVLKDETSAEAAGSLAANRIVCPGGQDYVCPIFAMTMLERSTNKHGDPRWLVRDVNGYAKKVIAQSLQLYPGLQVGTNGVPIVGVHNDWDPVGETLFAPGPGAVPQGIAGSNCRFKDHTLIKCAVDAAGATVTGLATSGEADARDWGPVKVFMNLGPGVLTFANLNAGSLIENRLNCPAGQDRKVQPGEAVAFIHPYYFEPIGATPQWWCLDVSNEYFPSVNTTGRTTTAKLRYTPALSPAALANVPAVTHDYDPGDNAIVRITTGVNGSIIDGLVPHGTVPFDGNARCVRNRGPGPLVVLPEGLSGSVIGNRFVLPNGTPLVLAPQASAWFIYDDDGKWKPATSGNALANVTYPQAVTPAAFPAANVDDWDPVDAASGLSWKYAYRIKSQGAVGTVLRTMNPPTSDGDTFLIENDLSGYTIKHGAAAGVTGRPFYCPGGADFILATYAAVEVYFSQGDNAWRIKATRVGGA